MKPAVYEAIKTSLWFVFFWILLDVVINQLFPYPSDPQNTSPGQLNLYFDYGRSIQGKVFRQLGTTDTDSAPLAQAGWLKTQEWKLRPNKPQTKQHQLIACYGMSFSEQACKAMQAQDPYLTLRAIGGPTAPPNYSYAAYQLDRKNHNADVVVLGILASSVQGLSAMTGMTWATDVPPPFTFPKYYVRDGHLEAINPSILSLEQLRSAKQNPQQWNQFVSQLQEHDRFFNAFVFKKNILDHSATIRLLRRAMAQNQRLSVTNSIHTPKGFNENWEGIPVLKAIVKEFTATAKADGRIPIVLLLNDRGYDDHLFKVLQSTLDQESIPYVSTHAIAPSTDLNNFLGDGHFNSEANQRIAQAMLEVIKQQSK